MPFNDSSWVDLIIFAPIAFYPHLHYYFLYSVNCVESRPSKSLSEGIPIKANN